MVLKEVTMCFFAITLLIIGVQGRNFDTTWVPMRVTSGVSSSGLSPLLWKLPHFLRVIATWPNLLIGDHNGPAGAQ